MKLNELIGKLGVPALVVFGAVVLWLSFAQDRREDEQRHDALIAALQDTMRVQRDEDGAQTAEIRTITTQPKVFVNMSSGNDPNIAKLQARVRELEKQLKKGGSVATWTSETSVDTVVTAERKPDGTIHAAAGDEWYRSEVDISPGGDARHRLSVRHDLSVAFVEQDGAQQVVIKDRNPHSSIDSLRSYATVPKEKGGIKWWQIALGAAAGYFMAR